MIKKERIGFFTPYATFFYLSVIPAKAGIHDSFFGRFRYLEKPLFFYLKTLFRSAGSQQIENFALECWKQRIPVKISQFIF
jgi:hypothetical protein